MGWIPTTDAERIEMLDAIGAPDLDTLFEPIPESVRLKSWEVPPGQSEMAVRDLMARIAGRNTAGYVSFLGGGYYDHFIPAAVDALASRSEFYTAYTPYQPECSQGTLQAIYEYQSAVCRLTGMDCANASLYDGGTAVFEAATMSIRITGRRRLVCHPSLGPLYRAMLKTHTANLEVEIADGDAPDSETACVIVQNPAFLGGVADYSVLARECHACGALLVVSFNPVSLGILKTPGEMGADIAVAEGQSLGLPLGFGGPYLGVMAVRKAHVRKMPGRIAGATQDARGRRGFVLTLQAREQHIRREKAMSNICSNEALCALRALIYLCLAGKEGLRDVAVQCHAKAEYLKGKFMVPGSHVTVLNAEPTFNEFAVRLESDASDVADRMLGRGFVAGLPLAPLGAGESGDLLMAVTEKRTRKELDDFAAALEKESHGTRV
ncbi:MAG TPA: aminomethyl-transferring glycine dehydrogenase subunit GcvPA [Candidatus Hydrogenedentes bacterium]|nr:aminomethyl-transferring glycine dehydrogenase subunit GcvPA [Candidatus Hydrogenedentota bacterium]HRT19035.1 aminomethyl-transferring glycine dehydrogenase subunit GcvPA [Candidatus Hydrogenedentota bacterium]HRT63964.1 aminomethyl-transferring glycine dehydrogenase subunit GcvPA [Candidatus Hydrogenedentota bacterium]